MNYRYLQIYEIQMIFKSTVKISSNNFICWNGVPLCVDSVSLYKADMVYTVDVRTCTCVYDKQKNFLNFVLIFAKFYEKKINTTLKTGSSWEKYPNLFPLFLILIHIKKCDIASWGYWILMYRYPTKRGNSRNLVL